MKGPETLTTFNRHIAYCPPLTDAPHFGSVRGLSLCKRREANISPRSQLWHQGWLLAHRQPALAPQRHLSLGTLAPAH